MIKTKVLQKPKNNKNGQFLLQIKLCPKQENRNLSTQL